MRIWTLHPQYLDRQGLTALWREGLLAQAVLLERTRGYRHHPQLVRFRAQADPVAAIGAYLDAIVAEAMRRGYRFNGEKVERSGTFADGSLVATTGQLAFEWTHLRSKLADRSPGDYERLALEEQPAPHPLFTLISGPVETWEKGGGS